MLWKKLIELKLFFLSDHIVVIYQHCIVLLNNGEADNSDICATEANKGQERRKLQLNLAT